MRVRLAQMWGMAPYGLHPVLSNPPSCYRVPMPLRDRSPDATTTRPHCPQCPSGHGDARIVLLKGQGRTVTYVCDRCLYEWDVTDKPKSHTP